MKTNHIVLLAILALCGLMTNPVAFSAQLPHRALPAPPIRSTPVPRPAVTPTPAPVPPAVASLVISYETSASSNIAITVSAGQAGAVTIGDDSLHDNCAVSSPCSGSPLLCNTTYVFRAFALDSKGQLRVSETITCATLPCVGGSSCTYTQGYWRTHPDAWPVTSLSIGTVTYQAAELIAILDNPAQGNGLVILVHQLIAAKLNIANGADPSAVQQAVTDADNMIEALVVPPIGNGYLAPGQTGDLTETLTEYNEGTIGPGHCND